MFLRTDEGATAMPKSYLSLYPRFQLLSKGKDDVDSHSEVNGSLLFPELVLRYPPKDTETPTSPPNITVTSLLSDVLHGACGRY